MKIAQVGTYPMDSDCIKGGVEASVYGLSKELAKNNEVYVLDFPRETVNRDSVETADNLHIFRFYLRGKNNFNAITRTKAQISIIKRLNPEVCHLHTTSFFALILYASLRFYHIPTVVTIHGLAHIEKKKVWQNSRSISNLFKYLFQSLVEFIFLTICPSFIVDTKYVQEAIETYKKQRKIFREPSCQIIPQGIDSNFFTLPVTDKSINLLSVGAIQPRKGHLLLIDAIAKVQKEVSNISLVIIGIASDKQYHAELVKKIESYNLGRNVKIYSNAKFEELINYYKKAEIFTLHTREESQGIVFCEAMAAGMPIVATNVGGVPYVIQHGVNGFLSNFGDIESFSNNILNLLNNVELSENMRCENSKKAQIYGWDQITSQILSLYKSFTAI
jgi:glycosyltransferase involved in cell wall biosynthesis